MAGKPLVENDAGSYLAWSGKEVAGEKLGCGVLVLKPLGFALPHYADSGKFGYVLGGSAVVGVLTVGVHAEEKVARLVSGDVIAVRAGEVSWWYNDAEEDGDDVTIVFMGDTSGAVSPGDITYFLLAGTNSVLGSLDAALLAAAASSSTSPEQANGAFRSQPATLLTRLRRGVVVVRPREHDRHGLVVNAGAAGASGETRTVITAAQLPALGEIGISVGITRVDEAGGVVGPWVVRDGASQAVYVARGSGRIQVAGAGGATTLVDEDVAAGGMIVVPRYAVALVGAGAGGMELVSLIKSPRAEVEHFTGKGSVLGGLSPEIVEAALNVSTELVEKLRK
uniref:Cupin type-1 domain-containing protein n=1 Tax=Leersia perrieri TaxID=77586 RepID=A0A0D9XGG7_9ORYZ